MGYRYSIFTLCCFVAIWEVAVRLLAVPQFILPPPSRIIKATWSLKEVLFFTHLPTTLLEIFLGLFISIILAIIFAVFMLVSPVVEQSIYPFLVVSQTIPIVVLSPVVMMWFGLGLTGKIVITVLITFFPIVVNTFTGLKNIDIQYINLLKTMGATPSQIFWKVRVPSCLPGFFTGLKIGAAVSVIGAVIGEWMGGNTGLGAFSRRMCSNLETDAAFAAVLILAFLGIGIFGFIKFIETIFIPWHLKSKNDKE